jgi:nucleotidyltransferase/DNA polymerase involved in DNA repair
MDDSDPVTELTGIGQSTQSKLHGVNISSVGELRDNFEIAKEHLNPRYQSQIADTLGVDLDNPTDVQTFVRQVINIRRNKLTAEQREEWDGGTRIDPTNPTELVNWIENPKKYDPKTVPPAQKSLRSFIKEVIASRQTRRSPKSQKTDASLTATKLDPTDPAQFVDWIEHPAQFDIEGVDIISEGQEPSKNEETGLFGYEPPKWLKDLQNNS